MSRNIHRRMSLREKKLLLVELMLELRSYNRDAYEQLYAEVKRCAAKARARNAS